MTEAGWTREKPIAAGWYWWRSLNGMIGPEIIQIDNTNGPDTDLEVIGPFGETPLDEWIAESEDEPGEWQGPLSPDSYQQGRVAGIKQGIEKLREREKFYTEQEAISEGQMRLARGLQRNESSCCIHELEQLAQAAQDEKGVGDGKV